MSSIITSKLAKLRSQVPFIPSTLELLYNAAPKHAVVWLFLLIAQGALPVLIVYLGRATLNGLISDAIQRTTLSATLFAVFLLASELLRTAANWVRTAQSELLVDQIYKMIHQKSASVDLAFYDSAEFYDHLHRARWDAVYRPVALIDSVGGLLQNGLTLTCMLIVLWRFGPWVPFALTLSTVPAVFVVLRSNLQHHRSRLKNTALERRSWYYDWLLTDGEAAGELRLFGLASTFKNRFLDVRECLRRDRLKVARAEFVADLLASFLALTVAGITLLFMVRRTLIGTITVGDLVLFFGAFQQGLRLGRLLLDNVGQLYLNSLFLENLFEFLRLEPKVVSPKHPISVPEKLGSGIECRNVSFHYPGSARMLLEDFNLLIPAGKITAIVGTNGSGKSTLLKLLCRFYDPDQGQILLDGTDLRSFAIDELRDKLSVVFQDPVRYNTTAKENVAIGSCIVSVANSVIQQATEASGAAQFIDRLPHQYETLLGKRFESGIDLSVGEWQRMALARAYLRQAPLLILDEPTSAMDPWAEAAWLDQFVQLAKGKTAIMITHRFSAATRADHIVVMREGQVCESGSHEELVRCNGIYATGWHSHLQSVAR